MSTFSPVSYMDRSKITLIRPLIYANEKEIKNFVKRNNIEVMVKSCPMDGHSKRENIKEYIYNHIEDIKNSIIKNENIVDFYYDDKDKSFDMVFYLDSVFDRVDKLVYNTGKIFDLNLSVESVREISQKVMEDDPINDDITNKVKCCDERMEY